MKKLGLLISIFFFVSQIAWGQLLVEDFDYPAGDTLTNHGWTAHSGAGTQPITVNSTGLEYPGYVASGVGLAALLDNNGEDINRTFTAQTSGFVYYSFMASVQSAVAGYFTHLGTGGTSFAARVFVQPSVNAGKINFGISNSSTAVYGTTDFDPLTTYLLIVKYEVAAPTSNVSLWVLPSSVPATEVDAGTPEVTTTTGTGLASVDAVYLRQYNAGVNIVVDGIRVGTSWAETVLEPVATPTLTVNPTSLTGFTYVEGAGPSTSQSYTLSGNNLTPADSTIIVAGSTNYEISSNDVNFSDTLKIDYTGGTLADTTIYVRLKAGLDVNTYDETISNTGGGADEQLVSVSGSVSPLTALYVTTASLTNFNYLVGEGPSLIKSYTLSGQNLTPVDNTIVVASPANYEVSNDSINFSDTLKIDYTGGSLTDTKIYVRLREGLTIGVYNGEKIVNSGGGAQDINVTLNGYVTFLTPIDSLKMNDLTGVSKMVGDTVNTTGIVTSILQLGTGTSGPGTIQNTNTAISVYGNSFTKTPNLQIGDSVVIYNWKVVGFSGLTELSYISNSSVEIISSGHTIEPLVVTIPDIKNQAWDGFEKYEGMYLQLNTVKFTQSGTFSGGTSGVNYKIFNGEDTLDLRIVKTNISLIGKTIPSGEVNVIGILQQYKTSAPYNSGYQIMPLDSSGIILVTGVNENKDNIVKTYQLEQNYPNPFNPSTKIRFSIPIAGSVKLSVYNILGQQVRTLINNDMEAGTHTVDFESTGLSSGIYIYKIEAGSFSQTRKMTLLK